ncbi:class I SAM-dependent methyltransferase [Lentisphaera profundi]|uniref:Class I SAM-dependent methyltransferase n=1 Tax=Lentisphaera profundi TaxID=1658616 RepID=A0ABY7VV60_9BACT|nr:class I SAM-dependent methyltransferase [Lentisphaera profundi]WDE95968.1 class I SAM-dependent methyltransferase [Lentisphaera profundi]
MKNFDKYATYYDVIYNNKDYSQEVSYIDKLLKKYSKAKTKTILELGCGTAGHAKELLKHGYQIHGLDMSEGMIEMATSLSQENNSFTCKKADIRDFNLNKKFDCAISLFHVMSYQTQNNDFLNALKCARKHLNREGLLIFDFWYGPGVLSDRPQTKTRDFETPEISIRRLTTPHMRVNENIVDGSLLLRQLRKQQLENKFDLNGAYGYTQMLKEQISGNNNSWAIRWYASTFLKNKLGLYVGKSLIQNIGNDNSGTHCGSSNEYDVSISQQRVTEFTEDFTEDQKSQRLIEDYFNKKKVTFFSKLKSFLSRKSQ